MLKTNYYDGQEFMASKKLGVKSLKELEGAVACVLPGTTTELYAFKYFITNVIKIKPLDIESTATFSFIPK
jgi:general L-amino acid transport system substrate-binding protein